MPVQRPLSGLSEQVNGRPRSDLACASERCSFRAVKDRTLSVDVLRGLVMILMALDHARDFFTSFEIDPTDLKTTTVALFVTRFVTHYCAPVFIFLAGTSVYLSRASGKTTIELAQLLVKRGLWMIVLELTVVRFCWLFNVDYQQTFLQVIWAIGWSMIVLAGLVFLPVRIVTVIGGLIVVGHNALDAIHVKGRLAPIWSIVHEKNWTWEPIAGHKVGILYPLVPWIGVMALGYACGEWMKRPGPARQRLLLRAGLITTTAFFAVRALNLYGDPHRWSAEKNAAFTVLSFFNVEKYPPSLAYLLITLGPALVFLSVFDGARSGLAKLFALYGRVPLFYYVAHLFVLNGVAYLLYLAQHNKLPPASGYEHRWSLAGVYAIWLAVVVALYPLCRFFGERKARGRSWVWSYL